MTNENNESEQLDSDDQASQDTQTSEFFAEQSVEELQELLSAAELKVAENWDKVVRANAEMENIKRRASRDVENARKFSIEKFASAILPVVDSLEQGLETSKNATDVSGIQEGMQMTSEMLLSILEKQGLTQFAPTGEKFNPELHEAMTMVESTDVPADHVMTVFQKGFKLNGRLVRPARVVVSRGSAKAPSIDEQA